MPRTRHSEFVSSLRHLCASACPEKLRGACPEKIRGASPERSRGAPLRSYSRPRLQTALPINTPAQNKPTENHATSTTPSTYTIIPPSGKPAFPLTRLLPPLYPKPPRSFV